MDPARRIHVLARLVGLCQGHGRTSAARTARPGNADSGLRLGGMTAPIQRPPARQSGNPTPNLRHQRDRHQPHGHSCPSNPMSPAPGRTCSPRQLPFPTPGPCRRDVPGCRRNDREYTAMPAAPATATVRTLTRKAHGTALSGSPRLPVRRAVLVFLAAGGPPHAAHVNPSGRPGGAAPERCSSGPSCPARLQRSTPAPQPAVDDARAAPAARGHSSAR